VNRREVVALLGGAATAWPVAGHAQQDRVRWIGVLMVNPDTDDVARDWTAAFEQNLARLGWTVGRNLAIDYRFGVSDSEKARVAVAQVLRLAPEVIVTNGGPALTAAQQATRSVPIVFNGVSEPVERGFVASMAHPGGNKTGFTNLEATMGGKWLELFKEIAPRVSRVTAVFNPVSTFGGPFFQSAETAARGLGVDLVAAHVGNPAEIDAAVSTLAREPGAGLIFPPDGFTTAYRREIVDLTMRYHLPAMGVGRAFAAEGGLVSYGTDSLDVFRRSASYVDRILRGEKPADLPVQNPVKFELVINVETARALGLTVPATLLATADEIIE
jgi:putative ABC transport system substrate-binding protein